jgi:hypothetical protein
MKKILLSLSICLAGIVSQSKAQAIQVLVVNNTPCDVFYTLLCDYDPSCSPSLSSDFITLPAGGIATYDAGTVPFTPPPAPPLVLGDRINGAIVYSSMPYCPAFASYTVGEPCSGLPGSASYYLYEVAAACNVCVDILRNATWTPAMPPNFIATLTFN